MLVYNAILQCDQLIFVYNLATIEGSRLVHFVIRTDFHFQRTGILISISRSTKKSLSILMHISPALPLQMAFPFLCHPSHPYSLSPRMHVPCPDFPRMRNPAALFPPLLRLVRFSHIFPLFSRLPLELSAFQFWRFRPLQRNT